jgi:hypothetical protein
MTPRNTRAKKMTAKAMYSDRLAKMTPTTINVIKIHGHAELGSAFFVGGSVIVYPLLSIDLTDHE